MNDDSKEKPVKHYHGHRERLRKRFLNAPDSLSAYECLELLLGYAMPRADTKPVAKELLDLSGGRFFPLINLPYEKAREFFGLTEYQYTLLLLSRTLTQRALEEKLPPSGPTTLAQIAQWVQSLYLGATNEKGLLIFLDTKNKVIGKAFQAEGTINETIVYPRRVVEQILTHRASAVILAHNHPSGDPSPSREDIEMTLTVRAACQTVNVPVMDHLIIGHNAYYSMTYEGDI